MHCSTAILGLMQCGGSSVHSAWMCSAMRRICGSIVSPGLVRTSAYALMMLVSVFSCTRPARWDRHS